MSKTKKIHEDELTIENEQLSIHVIKIGNKRLPLSIYRQLPIISVINNSDPMNPKLNGKVVGRISSKARHPNNRGYYNNRKEEFNHIDVLWITENKLLAIWPLSLVQDDALYILEKIPLPDRVNIFSKYSDYTCNLNKALSIFRDIKVTPITEWKKFDQIPPKPENCKLEYGMHLAGHRCGLNNDMRVEIIEQLNRDIKIVQEYENELEEWAKKVHPFYDEYINKITPKIKELNKRIDKRNSVYQTMIKQLNGGHQLFVGS